MSQRILLVAHHANPDWGSEPLIGWRWFETLSRRAEVTLITHIRNREAIEARREASPGTYGAVHYVDTERLAARIARWNDALWGAAAPVNRLILESVSQRAFDRGATDLARALTAVGDYDVIHRVSPISPRFPTRLVSLGLPVVVGPVNGGMRTCPGFDEVAAAERERALMLRPLTRVLDPLQRTWRGATTVLAANLTTVGSLPRAARKKAVVLCENAVDIDAYEAKPARSGEGLRVLYLGRLLRYKGVAHVIEGIAAHRATRNMTLDVVGKGPDRERLEALAESLGVADRVTFHGACAVEEVPRWMERCDVYAFPSVRESGGSTPLEAMAAAKPVIVVDHGGPAETVDETVGIKLSVTGPADLSAKVADALARLHDDEALRRSLGVAARRHVEKNYTWDAKINRALELYAELAGARDAAPAQDTASRLESAAPLGTRDDASAMAAATP